MKILFESEPKYNLCAPSYDHVHQIVQAIVVSMKKDGNVPTKIIAPIRGGLVPGVIASHGFRGVPVLTVDYSSYEGKGDDRNHSNNLKRDLFDKFDSGDTLLLIDDIVDSGKTFKEIIEQIDSGEFISGHGKVITAGLYVRPYSVFQPDYVGHMLKDEHGFVDFPWEV